MENIKKIIQENQEEFMAMVMDFVEKKQAPKKETQRKQPKTICHFTALGKTYDSDVFTKNYTGFLTDVSNLHGYELFRKAIPTFTKRNMSDFTGSALNKTSFVKLNNGGFVSCYSSTSQKMEHIKNICKELNVPVVFSV